MSSNRGSHVAAWVSKPKLCAVRGLYCTGADACTYARTMMAQQDAFNSSLVGMQYG